MKIPGPGGLKRLRAFHRRLSLLCAIPLLLSLTTGIALLLKSYVPWIESSVRPGSGKALSMTFPQILDTAKAVEESRIHRWDDVERIDIRPRTGVIRVRSESGWEIQIDGGTGRILHSAVRRTRLIASLHDGSWFHGSVPLLVMLPYALLMLLALATGCCLFLAGRLYR